MTILAVGAPFGAVQQGLRACSRVAIPPRAPIAVQFSAAMAFEKSSASRMGHSCRDGIAEGAVKHVARAGRVDAIDHEGR